ncbi:MAG: flagellin, partial [Propionicimonas sp.]
MGLRINNNIAAMNAHRNLTATDTAMGKSLEKLSSGL